MPPTHHPIRTLSKRVGLWCVNLWLAFHMFAIFISPAGMPPASPLLVNLSQAAIPYNELFFLNHGYHYFAPDPGPSTVMSYSIDRPGDAPIQGRFPTTEISPRLLYHRYFMLAENVGAFPDETRDRILESYARHFSRRHQANEITLTRLSHEPSSIPRIQAGGELNDIETWYEETAKRYTFASDTAERAASTLVLSPVDSTSPNESEVE